MANQDLPRRAATRAPIGKKVRLQYDDSTEIVEGRCGNISIGGMYVSADDARPQGTLVRFELVLDDMQTVRGLGEVVWMRPESAGSVHAAGMGVKFRYLEQRDRQLIFKLVSQHIKERLTKPTAKSPPRPAPGPGPSLAPPPRIRGLEVPPSKDASAVKPSAEAPTRPSPAPASEPQVPNPGPPLAGIVKATLPDLDDTAPSMKKSAPSAAPAAAGKSPRPASAPTAEKPACPAAPAGGEKAARPASASAPPVAQEASRLAKSPAAGEKTATPAPGPVLAPAPSDGEPTAASAARIAERVKSLTAERASSFLDEPEKPFPNEPERPAATDTLDPGVKEAPAAAAMAAGPADATEPSIFAFPRPDSSAEDQEPALFDAAPEPVRAEQRRDFPLLPVLVVVLVIGAAALYLLRAKLFSELSPPPPPLPMAEPLDRGAETPSATPPDETRATEEGEEDAALAEGDELLGEDESVASSGEDGEASPPVTLPPPPATPRPAPPSPAPQRPVAAPPPAASTGAAFTRLTDINWRPFPGGTKIVLEADGAIVQGRYKWFELGGESPRVVVRLLGVREGYSSAVLNVGSGDVRQIRFGFHRKESGDELHIVIDLVPGHHLLGDLANRGSSLELEIGPL